MYQKGISLFILISTPIGSSSFSSIKREIEGILFYDRRKLREVGKAIGDIP